MASGSKGTTPLARRDYLQSGARTLLYAVLYVFLEWLFLVTKPSFLGAWPVLDRLRALLIGTVPFVAAALALHGLLSLAAWSATKFRPRLSSRTSVLLKVTPALIVATTALILVDNFTYTVFGWGIVDATTYTTPAYWLLVLLVFVVHVRRQPFRFALRPAAAAAWVVVSGIALAWGVAAAGHFLDTDYRSARGEQRALPNIVFFAADGVELKHLSAFGYHRETSPQLARYLDRALVAENAITNSGWTTGSLTSMMTGKNPATTKVLYPPYTLNGIDAYQNLPRILRKLGYRGIQETLRYYADGPDLNWADSFDYANGRAVSWPSASRSALALQGPRQLVTQIQQRLSTRVRQLLFLERMQSEFDAVVPTESAKVYGVSDDERMARVYDFMRRAQTPFFAHIHLMGTHCCPYHPDEKYFSAEDFADESEASTAAYDDTIRESDRRFGELMRFLEDESLLENTIVVYSSDHTTGWGFRTPVPLLFLFPNAEHAGRLSATTQLLDVAPTILDYLEMEIPEWMEGRSLLNGSLDRHRPVFTSYRLHRTHFETEFEDRLARVVEMGPPTHGLKEVGMVVCQRWYTMTLKGRIVTWGDLGKQHAGCQGTRLPTLSQARAMMTQHLRERGFEF